MLLILYILTLPLMLMSTALSPTYDPLLANNTFLLFMALHLLQLSSVQLLSHVRLFVTP